MCWFRTLASAAFLLALSCSLTTTSSAHVLANAADQTGVDNWFSGEELTPEVRELMSQATQPILSSARRSLLQDSSGNEQCVWSGDTNECHTNATTVFTTIQIPTNVGDLRTRFWNCFNTNQAGCIPGTSPEYCSTKNLPKVTKDFPISGNVCLPTASPITVDSDLEDLLNAKNTVDTRCNIQTVSRECMIAFTTEMHYMGCNCDDTLKKLIASSERCFYSDEKACNSAELSPTGCPVCEECSSCPIEKNAGSVSGAFIGGMGAAALIVGLVYLYKRWKSNGHSFSFLTSNRNEDASTAFEPTSMGMGSPSAFAQGSDGRNWFTSKKSNSVQYTTSNSMEYAVS